MPHPLDVQELVLKEPGPVDVLMKVPPPVDVLMKALRPVDVRQVGGMLRPVDVVRR